MLKMVSLLSAKRNALSLENNVCPPLLPPLPPVKEVKLANAKYKRQAKLAS